ncbi:MAG: SDR family NAD(P)-dependent oxidoreductase [Calditrichaceae bacterium]
MKVLVTGGAGFIGSHLVDRLLENDFKVVVLDNLHRGKLKNIQKHIDMGKIEFIDGDIRDYDTVMGAVQNCDTIYHLAAQSNVMGAVSDLDYSFSTNVIGTFNMLKASHESGVRRFIFSSSREAYGEAQYLPVDEMHPLSSKNTYGASKVAGEKYCEVFQNMSSMEVVILRFANVYGERDIDRVIPIFLRNVANGKDIHIYGGNQIIDFISVHTVIDILIQSSDNKKALQGPTNVGSGKSTTLFDLANRIMELSGSKQKVIVDPPRSIEVIKFTADIGRMQDIFYFTEINDSLSYLNEMIIRE